MINKRSVVTTMFGYFGILSGITYAIMKWGEISQGDLSSICISFAYIFLSYNLLKLKDWSRVLLLILNTITGIIKSIVILSAVTLFILSRFFQRELAESAKAVCTHLSIAAFIFSVLELIYIYSFLIFFTRPKVKEQFIQEETIITKRRSKGMIILIVLFTISIFLELSGNYKSFSSIYTIPAPYLAIWFWFTNFVHIIGIATAAGLFLLKDIFRKMAIALLSFDLIRFIIEFPFVNTSFLLSDSPYVIITLIIINIIYDIVFIYFFSRPKIKEQFE